MDLTIEPSALHAPASHLRAQSSVPADACLSVYHTSGMLLMPGLWDMRPHIARPERGKLTLPLFVAGNMTGFPDQNATRRRTARRMKKRQTLSARIR